MEHGISRIGVVGGGLMGSGIAALAVYRGIAVTVREETPELADRAYHAIEKVFGDLLQKGKIDNLTYLQCMGLLEVTTDMRDLRGANLAVEAVSERLDIKEKIFAELDALLAPNAIIASNTSSLPIAQLAAATARPDRVLGMHFFNPPIRMDLVELVRGAETSKITMSIAEAFCREQLQRQTIRVTDRPGFIVNRLLIPYFNEAALAIELYDVDPHQIDAEAKAYGWPMGPFELLDFVGIDTTLWIAEFLNESCANRFFVPPLYRLLAEQGRMGARKTGTGFYTYPSRDSQHLEALLAKRYPHRNERMDAKHVFDRMMCALYVQAIEALEEEAASAADIELGAKNGIAFPGIGPLHAIDAMGHGKLLWMLRDMERTYGPRFAPPELLKRHSACEAPFFSE
ncbi:MAG: 3-hydroxyacyl-CoA dehydrogenase family protein [bacterium]|nr:3-hydroxyacyl-CoA dehydrogenase family protein [bacterium]